MKCNVHGLLNNAADALEDEEFNSNGGYAFALRELADNLRELRDRGDMAAMTEFFSLYTFPD
jgi:hypothetical protein